MIIWASGSFHSLNLDKALSTTPVVLFTLDNDETISAVLSNGSGVFAIPEPSSYLGLAGLIACSIHQRRRRKIS